MEKFKITLGGKPMTLIGKHLQTGDTAPAFSVIDESLHLVSSEQYKGKVLVMSVFPSINTPVCALQTKRFNQEAAALGNKVEILAISVDLPFALKHFCAVEGIDRVHAYSDHKELDFGMKYGFVIEELRLLGRGVVVVDTAGIIRHIEYVDEVSHEPNFESALTAIKALL